MFQNCKPMLLWPKKRKRNSLLTRAQCLFRQLLCFGLYPKDRVQIQVQKFLSFSFPLQCGYVTHLKKRVTLASVCTLPYGGFFPSSLDFIGVCCLYTEYVKHHGSKSQEGVFRRVTTPIPTHLLQVTNLINFWLLLPGLFSSQWTNM